jgi:hypothetical protein
MCMITILFSVVKLIIIIVRLVSRIIRSAYFKKIYHAS